MVISLNSCTAFCSALILGALLFLRPASAQTNPATASPQAKEANPDDDLHVTIAPYLWFAGVHGAVGALGHDTTVNASFGDVFKYFNIGAMGVVDMSYKRVILPLDFMWMKLSDDKALLLDDVDVQSVKAKMTETMLAPKIGYRVADGKRAKVDALFGVRYWHLSTDLTSQPRVGNSFSRSANWVDAVAGGRIQVALSPKSFIAVAGDAGGGSARWDYQAAGFFGYKISRKCVLLGGYRYLGVNYRPNGKAQFVYDVNMPGLLFGVSISVK